MPRAGTTATASLWRLMESASQAPPVVAVVVACDPGPWFEEALEALAAQDYPNLSVLIVDAASAEEVTPRVAAVLPSAYVRRLPANEGFAASADEALEVVEGASHLLFCHDDVAPAPDAVRHMVEEAFRSNAGVVAPKLVDWNEPDRLLEVGTGADKGGAPAPLVDRGELDQEQHDAVRDVFVAPGGCTLVRADLFASLGGFDRSMFVYGEDLDLSWRAQIAGARVIVAPAARVRHLEAMSGGRRLPGGGPAPTDPDALALLVRPLHARHRLRAVCKNYSTWHLVRVLPQVALLSVAEVALGLVSGHARSARATAAAWSWNLGRLKELRAARADVRRVRRVGDAEVRRLQAAGSARFSSFLRGQLGGDVLGWRAVVRRQDPAAPAPGRPIPVVGVVAAVVLLLGSRRLLTGPIPAVHELAPFPRGALGFLRPFLSGWRHVGLGSDDPAPLAFGILGVGGLLLGGATTVLQKLLVLGAIPVGLVGASRLARPLGSQRARAATLLVYLAVPLGYNALSRGRLSGVLAYAAAPWVVSRLLHAVGIEPFAARAPGRSGLVREVLVLGVVLAVVAAFVPPILLMAVLVALGLAAGSLLAGQAVAAGRAAVTTMGAVAVVAALLFPWTLDFVLPGTRWSGLTGLGTPPSRAPGLGALLRFETGPLGAPPIGWAFLVAAALPLLIGRGWRLAWAIRFWTLALVCWGVAWAGGRGWLPLPLPTVEVVLAPAAVALALAVALGMVAFEVDLRGYRFGWHQVASTAALVATMVGLVPVLVAALDGGWGLPEQDFSRLLSWMPEEQARGGFRVLWVGDQEALPLGAWALSRGVGFATSRDGPPDATALWPGNAPGPTGLLADAVDLARRGETSRLGHLLGPMAVRYVVVPLRAAPARERTPLLPPPPDVPASLAAQVDLKLIQSDDALIVYENEAWVPSPALLPPPAAVATRRSGLHSSGSTDLAGSAPALSPPRSPTRFEGRLSDGDALLLSEAASPRWQLQVSGRTADRTKAFGWANAFWPSTTGPAVLRYRASTARSAALVLEAALWFLAVRTVVRQRRSRDPGAG